MTGKLAVLVGNGLSIAYNPELKLEAITKRFLENLESESFDGIAVVRAMRKIAQHAFPGQPEDPNDFELLVGAFENSNLYLKELALLAENMEVDSANTVLALNRLSEFAERVRNTATSHILEVIMQNSRARHYERNVISDFVQEVCSKFDGPVVFGNLNYDSLLAASLVDKFPDQLSDMADGRRQARVRVSNSLTTGEASRLRTSIEDFQESRILLLHLHGSLTFWSAENGQYKVKLPVSLLTHLDQWSSIRTGKAKAYPLVALTGPSEKSNKVEDFPFNIAYRKFQESLGDSKKWLIAGYSFRDESVNSMLRTEFWRSAKKPSVLVIDQGDSLLLGSILDSFGWNLSENGSPDHWLTVNRDGLEAFPTVQEWNKFVAT